MPAVRPEDRTSGSVHLSADGRAVVILDQTQLPNREVYRELTELADMVAALKRLEVRGAPAIGIFAGYCMAVLALHAKAADAAELCRQLEADGAVLAAARPTAVNLSWAVRRMLDAANGALTCENAAGRADEVRSADAVREALLREAVAIHDEDIASCTAIAKAGLSLLTPGSGILTHCNAGPLATSKYGTALGPILLGAEQGVPFHVFADETRPLLQGARLTAWELQRAGVDVTLICDNMAASLMATGRVQAVLVGADRIAANGDVANKIGTLGVAVLAKHFGVPFYVCAPTSTFDLTCATGADIRIEGRDPEEIRSLWYAEPMAPAGVVRENPAFDVTPAELISAIVTERGILQPPFANLPDALR
ncbi:MAG: S-methyl-5-thioribose-1-phosphate isomerase [Eggerthellaceae bacterium]|nr:S-methyl-5-thioribose-1-phosphate isomerase [Eggerthellaceae bacterium]